MPKRREKSRQEQLYLLKRESKLQFEYVLYITMSLYHHIYIDHISIYIYIYHYTFPKKGDHDQCHMLPRRQRAAHAALQKTCGRRVSPERNCIFLPVGQRPRARAEGDPTSETLETLETSTPKICWLVVSTNPSEK